MTVLSIQFGQVGNVPIANANNTIPAAAMTPSIVYIATNDTTATVTAAGYLNALQQSTTDNFVFNNQQMALVYTTDNGCQFYQISVTGTTITLVPDVNPGNVLLPVTAGHIASFTNAAGQIGDTATPISHAGNITATGAALIAGTTVTAGTGITSTTGNIVATAGSVTAGSSGAAGVLTSFPGTAANGSLIVAAVNNAGNFTSTISNTAIGQASVYSLPDPANANARFLIGATATPFTANHSLVASGTGGLIGDAGYQMKVVAQAAVAGGAAAQSVADAFCTAASMVVCTWNDTTNAVSIQKAVAGNGSFVVTSSGDPGASHINYIITKV